MYGYEEQMDSWNQSRCNPFNIARDSKLIADRCSIVYTLSIPETPNIINIRNDWLMPFVKIGKLRSPIDGFHINVKSYLPKTLTEDELISDDTYTVSGYQSYLPHGSLADEYYYIVTAVAYNDAGLSSESNKYIIDHVASDYCFEYDIYGLTCDADLCCMTNMICK